MPLARAFTNRRIKIDTESVMAGLHLGRAASQRTAKPVRRLDISGPLALVSSTNNLSYDAPDIAGTSRVAVCVSPDPPALTHDSSSSDESEGSTNLGNTSPTITDNSSFGSPTSPQAEPNHLSCYFTPNIDTSSADAIVAEHSFDADMNTPNVPRRVASHSKRAHEHIHRKRTIQRMMSPPSSIVSDRSDRSLESESAFVGAAKESNPFGRELRQLDEVAEDYSSLPRSAEEEAEAAYLRSRNLAHLAASDYLGEIQSLIYSHFTEEPVWI